MGEVVPAIKRQALITSGEEPISLIDRGLSKATLEKYGVTLSFDESKNISTHFYPYYNGDEQVATKVRNTSDKTFRCSGQMNQADMFGKRLVPQGGKYISIAEGELDAMSICEMFKIPAISVKSATSAVKDCREAYKYLDSFEKIVVCFDKDEPKVNPEGKVSYPGQEAAEKVAKLFEPGKVLIMDMGEYKDPNEWLVAGKKEQFIKQWWRAKPYTPDSIINSSNLWDIIQEEQSKESVLYPYKGLNDKTYGMRKSELITITAGTGIGKSTFCKALAVHLKDSIPEDENIGLLMIEESTRETALSLMSMQAGIPFHLPDSKYSPEDMKKAYEEVLGDGRFYVQADKMFAYSDIDGILNTIKYLANGLNCKYIVLDHISIITSGQENGDERKALDSIVTKLKAATMQLDICLIIVCHLKRLSGTPAEEGAQITLNDLRGTHGIGQLSNIIIALERNGQSEDATEANTINLRVLKNRYCGRLGVANAIVFDDKTMKFNEVEEIDESEYGGETYKGD